MGTAAEVCKEKGQVVTMVRAIARGNGGRVEGLPLSPNDRWSAAATATGGRVRYEVRVAEVSDITPSAIVLWKLASNGPEPDRSPWLAVTPNHGHFVGDKHDDPTRKELEMAGVDIRQVKDSN